MSAQKHSSGPGRDDPNKDVPPPENLPKNFPERAPLTDDGIEAAKKEAASPMKNGLNREPGDELDDEEDEGPVKAMD